MNKSISFLAAFVTFSGLVLADESCLPGDVWPIHADVVDIAARPLDVVVGSTSWNVPGVGFSGNLDMDSPQQRELLAGAEGFPAAAVYGDPGGAWGGNHLSGFLREPVKFKKKGLAFIEPFDYGVVAYPGVIVGDTGIIAVGNFTAVAKGFSDRTRGRFQQVSAVRRLSQPQTAFGEDGLSLRVWPGQTNQTFSFEDRVPPDEVLVDCYFDGSRTCSVSWVPGTEDVPIMPGSPQTYKVVAPKNIVFPEKPRRCVVRPAVHVNGIAVAIAQSVDNDN
jgi:hypothetical protein